jgi:putative membrane protein
MAGMLLRLYAYDAERAGGEPLRSEMRGLLRTWQHRLLKIIINPSMTPPDLRRLDDRHRL